VRNDYKTATERPTRGKSAPFHGGNTGSNPVRVAMSIFATNNRRLLVEHTPPSARPKRDIKIVTSLHGDLMRAGVDEPTRCRDRPPVFSAGR
jgi:hypothetical protein